MSNLEEQHRDKAGSTTYREILTFYIPLGLTTLLITTTHSLFNAGLAKLHNPEIYIAAFAVAKSLHGLLQSPTALLRQAVTSLVECGQSFKKLKAFAVRVCVFVVFLYALTAFTGISKFVFGNIMGIKGMTLEGAVTILKILVLFPVFITMREFGHGVAIMLNSTPLVTLSTMGRVVFVFVCTLVITKINHSPEIIIGFMFLGAIITEGLIITVGNRYSFRNISMELKNRNYMNKYPAKPLVSRDILRFCLPLLAMNYIKTLAIPIITMLLARTDNPDMAISAYTVAWDLAVILFGPLMIYHQVPINYSSQTDVLPVRRFTVFTGIFLTAVFGLIAFTPIGYWILKEVIGTSTELSRMSSGVLKVLTLFPVVMIIKEYYWGKLMKARLTKYVGKGKFFNMITLSLVVLSLSCFQFNNPAIIGAIAMIIGTAIEAFYLYYVSKGTLCMLDKGDGL